MSDAAWSGVAWRRREADNGPVAARNGSATVRGGSCAREVRGETLSGLGEEGREARVGPGTQLRSVVIVSRMEYRRSR